jgi:prepilin-type N-terminal cleavage/methylation domain-containing protein
MRRGYTVVELTLVLAIIALLLGIALPRIAPLRDGWSAEQAAQAVILAHSRARVAASLLSRPLVRTVAPDSLRIATLADSVVWRGAGPAASGASLAGPIRKLTCSPVGLSMGLSNATFQITRGAAIRTVVVSRLGRVRIQRGF